MLNFRKEGAEHDKGGFIECILLVRLINPFFFRWQT